MVGTTREKQHLHLRGQIDTHACFRDAVGDSILIFTAGERNRYFAGRVRKVRGEFWGVRLIQGADCFQFFGLHRGRSVKKQ